MRSPAAERSRRTSFAATAIAAVCSVIFVTGIVAIAFATVAAWHGFTIGDLYAEIFPRLRGRATVPENPHLLYTMLVIYALVTAQLAIYLRRRIIHR